MTDAEIVHHYNLPSAYPEEWPAELDDDDFVDDDESKKPQSRDHKSRYFALERTSSYRGSNLGSTHRGDDRDNPMIPKDEPDPLGLGDSVVRILKRRGLPVDEDNRLRNRFLLSSTSFSPALFLSQTHSSASINALLQGLEHLSQSIDQKSASLKVLVEANFERFVRAKATIDSVYNEMRNQGAEQQQELSVPGNRLSAQFRSPSRGRSVSPGTNPGNRKNALTKESEFGMKGIRAPLVEASVKAEELWGPALSGREREQVLKSVMDTLEKHRDVYELGSSLSKSIKQRDYAAVFAQYTNARILVAKAKHIAEVSSFDQRSLTDNETHTILATGRMWVEVDQQIQAFKHDLWRRLDTSSTSSATSNITDPVEEHMELIGALLELGVDENPIWVWLHNRYEFLKTKITSFCERSQVEIEILRRRLATGEKPTSQTVASYLRQAPRDGADLQRTALDTDQVIELWECIHTYLSRLLSQQGGLFGEVADFWETARSFIQGRRQNMLPAGFEGESRIHHRLSSDNIRELQDGVHELITLIRESLLSLFAEPPVEDISMLASPTAPPSPSSPIGSGITPSESRFKLDPSNLPLQPPKPGEPWEDFAFWPPYSNCLSGVYYLSRFLAIVGTAASEMAALGPSVSGGSMLDSLRSLVSVARERSVRVACAVWNRDAEHCKLFEDWTRDPERRDLTKMPGCFMAFESAILGEMQKILYIPEVTTKSDAADVVAAPPSKLLQIVRAQFVSSVYKALSGLVENAEKPTTPREENEWILVGPAATANAPDAALTVLAANTVDAENRVSTHVLIAAYEYILTRTECPRAPDVFQSHGSPGRPGSAAGCQLRVVILRYFDRRGQHTQQCTQPNRHSTLPIVHRPDYRFLERDYIQRHPVSRLGSELQPTGPRPAVRLQYIVDAGACAYGDFHDHSFQLACDIRSLVSGAFVDYIDYDPYTSANANLHISLRSILLAPEVSPSGFDAGDSRYRVHWADRITVRIGRCDGHSKPDICGIGPADNERCKNQAPGGTWRGENGSEEAKREDQGRICMF